LPKNAIQPEKGQSLKGCFLSLKWPELKTLQSKLKKDKQLKLAYKCMKDECDGFHFLHVILKLSQKTISLGIKCIMLILEMANT